MTQHAFQFAQDEILPSPKPAKRLPVARVADPDERERLHRQSRLILDRLRKGPMSNAEMALIAKKYTNRVSEIRAYLQQHEGQTVKVVERNHKTGFTTYAILSYVPEGQ